MKRKKGNEKKKNTQRESTTMDGAVLFPVG
jgi:hypothetical protein